MLVTSLLVLSLHGLAAPVSAPAPLVEQAQTSFSGGIVNGASATLPIPVPNPLLQFLETLEQYLWMRSPEGQQFLMDLAPLEPASTQQSGTGMLLDFEEFAAPVLFKETRPLRGPIQGQARSWAPNRDGGAILNHSGNFGVLAISGQNFLAFNAYATYGEGGGTAMLPQIIRFSPGSETVSLWLSAGMISSGQIVVEAFGSQGTVGIYMDSPTLGWKQISFTGEDISGLAIYGSLTALVIDDIIGT